MKSAVFYGWWVVTALFFIEVFGPMGRYSLTALGPFIEEELSWSRSQIGLAFSIHLWIYSGLVLVIGWLVDRIGSRRVFFIGGVVLMIALTILSRLNSLWQLYLFYGLVTALGVGMTHLVPTQTTCRKWFVKRAGLVCGIAYAGINMGPALLTPIMTGMASSLGWRTTWLVCAISFGVVIMLIAGLVIRSTPESMGLHPDGIAPTPSADEPIPAAAVNLTTGEALRTLPFWLLFIFKSLSSVPLQGMLTQVVTWGADLGEPLATTGIFMTAFTVPSMLSNVVGGWMGDRCGKLPILIWTNIACLLVMLGAGLLVNSRSSLLIVAILFGISTGMVTAPVIPFMGDLYGRKALGTLVGINTFGSTFFGGFGPLVWGAIADATGSYNPACLLSAVLCAISTVALVLIRPAKLAEKQ